MAIPTHTASPTTTWNAVSNTLVERAVRRAVPGRGASDERPLRPRNQGEHLPHPRVDRLHGDRRPGNVDDVAVQADRVVQGLSSVLAQEVLSRHPPAPGFAILQNMYPSDPAGRVHFHG